MRWVFGGALLLLVWFSAGTSKVQAAGAGAVYVTVQPRPPATPVASTPASNWLVRLAGLSIVTLSQTLYLLSFAPIRILKFIGGVMVKLALAT